MKGEGCALVVVERFLITLALRPNGQCCVFLLLLLPCSYYHDEAVFYSVIGLLWTSPASPIRSYCVNVQDQLE